MLQLLVPVFTELKCKWFDGKIYSRYNHGTKGGNKKQMKKTKSLILGALVACAVVLAMLLAIPANAMMVLNANLNVCEEDEAPMVWITYYDAVGSENSHDDCGNAYNNYTLLSFEECGFTAPEGKVFKCWMEYGPKGDENEITNDTITLYTSGRTFYAVWEDAPVEEPAPAPAPETPEQPEIEEPVVEQPTEEVKPADNDNNGLGLGAILGIVFGSLAVLGLGGSMLWMFVFRK